MLLCRQPDAHDADAHPSVQAQSCTYVDMCVCMYVCMYVLLHACLCMYVCLCMDVWT